MRWHFKDERWICVGYDGAFGTTALCQKRMKRTAIRPRGYADGTVEESAHRKEEIMVEIRNNIIDVAIHRLGAWRAKNYSKLARPYRNRKRAERLARAELAFVMDGLDDRSCFIPSSIRTDRFF